MYLATRVPNSNILILLQKNESNLGTVKICLQSGRIYGDNIDEMKNLFNDSARNALLNIMPFF